MTDWIDTLEKSTRLRWKQSGDALLLSHVPALLLSKGIDLSAELQGRKLREAIEIGGKGKVKLVQNPEHPLVWGIIPNNVNESDAEKQFLQVDDAATGVPRFKRSVWTAFIRPLAEGKRRIIRKDKNYRFDDIPRDGTVPSHGVEVNADKILSENLSAPEIDAAGVASSISEWAEASGQDITEFYAGFGERAFKPHRHRDTTWISSLAQLRDEDLSRIMIPLDIVRRLLGGRVGSK